MGVFKLRSIPGARRARPRRVLIVDDVPDNREMYVEYLEFCGLTVEEASSAEEALMKLEASDSPPDAVIMDLSLPKMDGLEATRWIKSNARFAETKVVMLSGFAGPKYERLALEAGADAFATKPCTPTELLQRIVSFYPKAERVPAKRTTRTRRKR